MYSQGSWLLRIFISALLASILAHIVRATNGIDALICTLEMWTTPHTFSPESTLGLAILLVSLLLGLRVPKLDSMTFGCMFLCHMHIAEHCRPRHIPDYLVSWNHTPVRSPLIFE